MVTVLRPLSTSELLDRTFHLYRNNFSLFLGITAIPQLVVLGLNSLIPLLLMERRTLGLGTRNQVTELALVSVLILITEGICVRIAHAATAVAVSDLHLEQPAAIIRSFQKLSGNFFRVVWVSVVLTFLIWFGLALLIIPGVYWGVKYALSIPVAALERSGLSESLSRSSDLTEYNRGRVFLILALLTVLNFVALECIRFVFGLKVPVLRTHYLVASYPLRTTLIGISAFITGTLVGPLITIAMTLVYYDERVRREGFDLQYMMSALETNAQSAAPANVPAS